MLKKHKKLFDNLDKKIEELIEFVSSVVERGKKAGRIRQDIATEDIVYSFGGMVTNMSRALFRAVPAERFDAAEKARAISTMLFEGISTHKEKAV
jgi:hypothetical protein